MKNRLMKNLSLIVLIISNLTFVSCGNRHEGEQKPTLLSNLVSISKNENNGVTEILGLYGGYCKYSIGASASTETGKENFFTLELGKSEALEKKAKIPEMSALNIAYLFYRNLNKKERNNYDEIRTVLIFANGEKMMFKYPTELLEIIDQRMKVVNNVVGLIKDKNYDAIGPMIKTSSFVKYDKNDFISKLTKADPQFGNVTKGFMPMGFKISKSKDDTDILHISGFIFRDKLNNEFSVYLDLNGKDNSIFLLEYKL